MGNFWMTLLMKISVVKIAPCLWTAPPDGALRSVFTSKQSVRKFPTYFVMQISLFYLSIRNYLSRFKLRICKYLHGISFNSQAAYLCTFAIICVSNTQKL
jgi:hypothetical protein